MTHNAAFSKSFNVPSQLININALTNSYYNYDKIESIAKWIQAKVDIKPKIAIICGSGLGSIANLVQNSTILEYEDIPEFPVSTVDGHKGNLTFGELNGVSVVCMQGRFHPYEGYSVALCAMPVKLFKILGVKLIVITNAAGGMNHSFTTGDLMLIKDHMSLPVLSLDNPLVGPNDTRFGPRFFSVTGVYPKNIRNIFKHVCQELNAEIHEGVYSTVGGPTYETVSDVMFLKSSGADAVGMSTSHEATVAAYCGLKVLAFSIITDMVEEEFDSEKVTDHAEICKVANLKCKQAESLVSEFVKRVSTQHKELLE